MKGENPGTRGSLLKAGKQKTPGGSSREYKVYLQVAARDEIYDLQNFLTRSPVMEALSQQLPSLGLQSRRMVITRSASL